MSIPARSEDGGFLWPMQYGEPPLKTESAEAPVLKQHEQDKLIEVNEGRVEILDLSDKKQLDRYRGIVAMVARGWATLSAEERQWVPENRNWVIFIRYLLLYQTPDTR